ncbi:extracellular solute-binding protein [Spongiactinospora sp. TRM90649]|uniref:ABC transporter substrate-binding protein n=1 Tax=Spongiactinospora sp. TRM90649 TaxID=3031114 RepID=UPI0023F82477|nr:extracellular solute-binding protein [Spongiactinospora sp. TRM90649]MDF5756938.1 extracellular solute-binding protein [Spongiactinospora sp. TRM90649]
MKPLKFGILAAAATVALAGCGGGSGAGALDAAAVDRLSQDATALGGAEAVAAMQDLYRKAVQAGESKVTVYGPVEQDLKPVYEAFTKRFPGISVLGVPAFGPALDQKINSEQASGKHVGDLVHTGTTVIDYGKTGKLEQFRPVTTKDLSDQVADPEGFFYGNQYGGIGYVINTEKISKADAPKNWRDMGDPRFKGKIVMADPRKPGALVDGMSNMLFSGDFDRPGIERIAANEPLIVDSSDLALQAVVTGQRAVAPGLGFTAFNQAKKKGAPVDMVFPLQGPTPMTVTYYGILKGAPNPNAARLLETWMFTPEAMSMVPQAGLWGSAKGSPGMSGYPGIDEIQVVKKPPFAQSEQHFNETIELMKQIFR